MYLQYNYMRQTFCLVFYVYCLGTMVLEPLVLNNAFIYLYEYMCIYIYI